MIIKMIKVMMIIIKNDDNNSNSKDIEYYFR